MQPVPEDSGPACVWCFHFYQQNSLSRLSHIVVERRGSGIESPLVS